MNHVPIVRVAGSVAMLTLGLAAPAAASPSRATPTPSSGIAWGACPSYSDAAITSMGFTAGQVPAFRALTKRLECGTVSVPLDHDQPDGRTITIAVTRLRATGTGHRLGAVASLAGGPGNPGYLDPIRLTLRNAEMARLNDRYDIVGFDARGVNYSTKVQCPESGPPGGRPGKPTEAEARGVYDAQVADNQTCGQSAPAFLAELTTENIARDLDRIRAAMGERELSLFGQSYGTWLGMVYRSMFPGRVQRAFLDSVAPPWTDLARHDTEATGATERNFARMAAWIAEHHRTYDLGVTAQRVRATVLKLRRTYDDDPRTFTDLPRPIDGAAIADLAGKNSPDWPTAARALAELRDATGPTAPPTVKKIFGAEPGPPVPGVPEFVNPTMNRAVKCNEDGSRPAFSSAWTSYRHNLERYPVTTRGFGAGCAGWPLPVQRTHLHRGGGSLVLAGHLYEYMSVYKWTLQSRKVVGGKVYTVADDVHGSATREPACAADVVAYFNTGRIDRGCDGVPKPTP